MKEADGPDGILTGDGASVVTAIRLMRLALPLLDRAGSDLAAARLQHAIDEAEFGSAPVVAVSSPPGDR